ncbi:MAG: hypothetical protein J6W29_03120 [Neisseriaceae bacterium]|nr:hypothetical protein [Neisseriaceae bacterium]
MKRRIADFGVVIYNNEGQVEVAFNKARKVPKAYDSFVACIEIACLSAIQKVMSNLDKGKGSGEGGNDASDKRDDADNKGNEA